MGADMAKKRQQAKKDDGFPTVAELKKAVEGQVERITPQAALRSLIYRGAPKIDDTLRKIARNPERQIALRKTAAIELGRSATPTNRKALMELLEAEEPALVRRAAEGLGRIGNAATLEKLKSLRPRDQVVRRAVTTAKTLLSYRLGEKAGRLSLPEEREVLELGKAKARRFEIGSISTAELKEMRPALERELPSVAISEKGGLELDCGDGHYRIVFNNALAKKGGLSTLTESSAVMGAVLKRTEIDGRYTLDSYLLTHPSHGRSARLFAMKGSGVVSYYGDLTETEQGATFAIRALNTRFSQPVELEGRIEARTLDVHLETAKVAAGRLAGQVPPKRPRRLGSV